MIRVSASIPGVSKNPDAAIARSVGELLIRRAVENDCQTQLFAAASRASSCINRRREPGLSRCHPTRWPITLLPSIKYIWLSTFGQAQLVKSIGSLAANGQAFDNSHHLFRFDRFGDVYSVTGLERVHPVFGAVERSQRDSRQTPVASLFPLAIRRIRL